jgi:ribosomal-protein-alanine N-acetyltransferase
VRRQGPGSAPAIRRAAAGDLPGLGALESACFPRPWSAESLAGTLASPACFVLVAEGDAGLTGCAAFRSVADEAELLRVAVCPGHRRRGLAWRLVEAGLAELAGRGVARCTLEVRPDNRPALALYRRLGFALEGERPAYYADGARALVLALDLRAIGRPASGRGVPGALQDPP